MKNYKRRDFINRTIIIIAISIILFSLGAISGQNEIIIENYKENKELRTELDNLKQKRDSLQVELDSLHVISWDNIEYFIDTLHIAHKDVVMRQIALETGSLSSAICQENHNLFGMKEPRIRETTALGTKRGHAYYKDYIDSIKDYKLWQDARRVNEETDYYAFLAGVGYAEASNYINTLKNI